MTKRGNHPRPGKLTLSHARQVEILRRLCRLCDSAWEYSEKLQRSGFDSFLPWQKFQVSFCEAADFATHRLYVIEEAKLRVGTPDGAPGHFVGGERGYKSAFIERLRAERDAANRVPFHDIPSSEFWRRELDPCARRRVQILVADRSVEEVRRREMNEDRRRRRQAEIARHTTGYGRNFTFDAIGFSRLIPDLFRAHFCSLGFQPDARRTREYFPVYSKTLTPSWDLCWSTRNDRELRMMPQGGSPGEPLTTLLDLALYVRAKNHAGFVDIPLGFEWLDTMMIRYASIVSGFEWAYGLCGFEHFDDLETMVKAHACLYGLVAESVEPTLQNALEAD